MKSKCSWVTNFFYRRDKIRVAKLTQKLTRNREKKIIPMQEYFTFEIEKNQ